MSDEQIAKIDAELKAAPVFRGMAAVAAFLLSDTATSGTGTMLMFHGGDVVAKIDDQAVLELARRGAAIPADSQPDAALRDRFAMVALNGMLSYSYCNNYSGNFIENGTPEGNARTAYAYADAMMKARSEPPRGDLQRLEHTENPNVEHLTAPGADDIDPNDYDERDPFAPE